jgi:SAM-dependent methyltransferase
MNPLIKPPRGHNPYIEKRPVRSKESQFTDKNGHRHHIYDSEKAPYPVSFDKHVLELEALDTILLKSVHNSMSFVDFSQWEEGAPVRSLDLGCGTGTWVLEAAREWPGCEFVGFDLVNVQPPRHLLENSVAKRIEWIHGNFLTNKLPFDDDEFDHVHIQSIARSVPENKWGMLFEEVNRILRPGGAVEVCEEDIIFPRLPRWFTSPLRSRLDRGASVHLPDTAQRVQTPKLHDTDDQNDSDDDKHDHALLESLYKSVFWNRFINTTPTAVLPSYFQTYFRQIAMGPVVTFPMPPLAPLQPLPQQVLPNDITANLLGPRSSISVSSSFSSPRMSGTTFVSPQLPVTEPISGDWDLPPVFGESSSRPSSSGSSKGSPSVRRQSISTLHPDDQRSIKSMKKLIVDSTGLEISNPPLMRYLEGLSELSERSLAMHLYHSYQYVLSCEEAMWEELKDRILNKREGLKKYGWEDDEELEELHSRKKFELLIERYRSDMQSRVSLWVSLTGMGWVLPPRDPLTKAELIEEERLRQKMLEARKNARPGDVHPPCRVMRILVGHKQEILI